MKIILMVLFSSLMFVSCKKDRYVFTMECITLNEYRLPHTAQNISLKVVAAEDTSVVIASTESFPGALTLPVTFAVSSHPHLHLYKDNIAIQLWGDSTGFIASSTLDMKEYKILFPIDMETKNDNVNFSVKGSWE